ncbi:MAG: SDR family oxidoreductase [Alphaproteobacteria bacterium]|nr:SDR family oxidoreductase [Alphaproteobacteria bacterium]
MRTLLVTGAGRGIGRGIAEAAAASGWRVVGLTRSAPPGRFPGEAHLVDLADPVATGAALATVLARQPIDALVNNAGIITTAPIGAVDLGEIDAMWAVNVRAIVQVTQACLPRLRESPCGRVVNLGSRAGLGKIGRAGYSATKAAIVGLTRTMALELARDRVTVNCVAPGPVSTALFDGHNDGFSTDEAAIARTIPLGRMGTPGDVAAAVLYFLSPGAGFVTGQTLYVCGGLSIGAVPF